MPVASKSRLAKSLTKATAKKEPVWEGPDGEGLNGGVTQSLLSRFLCCRERFRLLVVDGLKVQEGFSHRLEYGNLWHAAEEEFARTKGSDDNWIRAALDYAKRLAAKYRDNQAEIKKWYNVLLQQFPVYVDFWKKHPDVLKRKPVFQEQAFNVPYKLPSGRIVRLRGKYDAVDLINGGLWIQENKARGEVDQEKLQRELPWDLQSNIYLTALEASRVKAVKERGKNYTVNGVRTGVDNRLKLYKLDEIPNGVAGIRYNVIRRPLSSYGKYNISQKKGLGKAKKGAETEEQFYERLGGLIKSDPKHFFFRVKMEVTPDDLKRFQTQCLNPILQQLCDWWDSIQGDTSNPWFINGNPSQFNPNHYRYPTGVWNPLLEGRSGDLDNYLATGDDRGLQRANNLFPELQEVS